MPPSLSRRSKRTSDSEWRLVQISRSRAASLALGGQQVVCRGDPESGDVGPLVMLTLVAVPLLLFSFAAMNGYEGREHTVGIDLGTTNSVVCLRESRGFVNPVTKWWFGERSMRNNRGTGEIKCVPDLINGAKRGAGDASVIVPSVVTVLNSTDSAHSHVLHKRRKRTYWEEILPRPLEKEWWIDLLPMPETVKTWLFPPAVVYAPLEAVPLPFRRTDDGEKEEVTADVHVGTYAHKILRHDHPQTTVYHAKRYIGKTYPSASKDATCDSINDHDGKVGYQIVSASEDTQTTYGFRLPLPPDFHVTLTPRTVGSLVLQHLRRMTETYLGHAAANSVVVTVPAKFDENARAATLAAYADAGYHVARVLEEPVAAAIAYGLQNIVTTADEDGVKHVLVYDFGGGTLDVSVLYLTYGGNVEVVAVDGDMALGGADFDATVGDHVLVGLGGAVDRTLAALEEVADALGWTVSEVAEEIVEEDACADVLARVPEFQKGDTLTLCHPSAVRTMAESLKMDLSTTHTAATQCLAVAPNTTSSSMTKITDLCQKLQPVVSTLEREAFDALTNHLVRRSAAPIYRVLEQTGLDVDGIDEVVMVGGTTRIPAVRELVRTVLGKYQLNLEIDPDLTVAYGAASVLD